jgi:hypothetical protein
LYLYRRSAPSILSVFTDGQQERWRHASGLSALATLPISLIRPRRAGEQSPPAGDRIAGAPVRERQTAEPSRGLFDHPLMRHQTLGLT